MTSSMAPLIFLVAVLVAAVVLFSIIGGSQNRGRTRRSGRSYGGGGGNYRPQAVARLDRNQIADRWSTIQAMAEGGGNGLRTAVSEADKLLDHVMRQSGAAGDTMGDRLKSFRSRFSDNNGVWRAHKLRNALAHEVGFDLVASQAREALRDFERALRDLGAL